MGDKLSVVVKEESPEEKSTGEHAVMAHEERTEFKVPQWLHDFESQASKACPSFSLSDEFQHIHEAKQQGEDPLKTVFGISDEDLETYSLSNELQKLHDNKKEGRGPSKTVYRNSTKNFEKNPMVKQVENLQIQTTEDRDHTHVREEQRSSISDEAGEQEGLWWRLAYDISQDKAGIKFRYSARRTARRRITQGWRDSKAFSNTRYALCRRSNS
jgi:hypothetical protein